MSSPVPAKVSGRPSVRRSYVSEDLLKSVNWCFYWLSYLNAMLWFRTDGEHPLDRTWGVVAWSVSLSIYLLMRWARFAAFSTTQICLALTVQGLLLLAQNDFLPFTFHLVALATSLLVIDFLRTCRLDGDYERSFRLVQSAGTSALCLAWALAAVPLVLEHDRANNRISEAWFRLSHGFHLPPQFFFSGRGAAMARHSVRVEKRTEGYFINKTGPFEQLHHASDFGLYPLLAVTEQREYCIDGNGNPYFMPAYGRIGAPVYPIRQISTCHRDNEPIIVLEGATYKLVTMDGTELRKLPYQEIDFGPYADRFGDKPLAARRSDKWGLISKQGEELISPISDARLKDAQWGYYVSTSGEKLGLAAPFREHALAPGYTRIESCAFFSNHQVDGPPGVGAVKIPYEGVYCLQDAQGSWGIYAAHQTKWIIEIGHLSGVPNLESYPPPRPNSAQFTLDGGDWKFEGNLITDQQFVYDHKTQSFRLRN